MDSIAILCKELDQEIKNVKLEIKLTKNQIRDTQNMMNQTKKEWEKNVRKSDRIC